METTTFFQKFNSKAQKQSNFSVGENYKKFLQFLKEQKTIRFYLDQKSGTGHQSSTLLIMQLLIELWVENGFNSDKSVELIYVSDYNRQIILDTLPQLNGETPKVKGVEIRLKPNITFLSKKLELGFTCGYDELDNLAEKANVRYFLRLQPLFWRNVDQIHYKSMPKITTLLNNYTYQPGFQQKLPNKMLEGLLPADFRSLPYLNEFPKEPDWNLQDDEVKFIKQILEKASSDIELCITYRIDNETKAFLNKSYEIIFNLVTSFTMARLDKTIQKGVVILNFSPKIQNDELKMAKDFFDSFVLTDKGLNENIEPATKTALTKISQGLNGIRENLKESKIQVNFMYKDLCSYDEISKEFGDNNSSFNIILLRVPKRLPSDVFNYTLTKGTLPSIFEGSGTASIAITTGNPYLKVNPLAAREEYHYLYIEKNEVLSEKNAKYCQEVANRVADRFSDWLLKGELVQEMPVQAIADFIKKYRSSNSELKGYFDKMKSFYSDKNHNKLTLGLALFNIFIENEEKR